MVQIDSDNLGDFGFTNYIASNFGATVNNHLDAADRFAEIQKILLLACGLQDIAHASVNRHALFPAVENTEAWCVAAADPSHPNIESTDKTDLAILYSRHFGVIVGKTLPLAKVKSVLARREYCKITLSQHGNILLACPQFNRAVAELTQVI